jgi:hypothetical protein
MDSIRSVWEDKEKGENNGCLNRFCCDATLYYAKSKFDLLVYFSIILAIFGVTNYTISVSLITFLDLYTIKRLVHDKKETAIGIAILLVKILCIIFAVFLYKMPDFYPYIKFQSLTTDPSFKPIDIESRYL